MGRSKAHPQSVALSAFQFCFARDISLKSQWIPRSLNEKAGQLSRFVDKDDWSPNPSVFQLVYAKWGPPQSLFIPEWPSSFFWPFLRQGCQFKPFVVEVFSLPAISNLLLEGPGQSFAAAKNSC